MRYVKLSLVFLAFAAASACAGASGPKADAVEIAQVCSASMQDKDVVVQGFLQVADKVPCMKALRPQRDCAFKILDKVNVVGNEPLVFLPEGDGANQVRTPESSRKPGEVKPSAIFTRDDVRFKLDDGTEVVPTADVATPVTVTGTVNYSENGGEKLCGIYARKIEKRQ